MNSGTLVVTLVMVAVMYLVLYRPQQRRIKQHQMLLSSLAVGDQVVTAGGIFGEISALDDESVTLDVGGGTRIKFARQAIARKLMTDVAEEGIG